MSLDGFIAGPKGAADWIPMDPDIDFRAIFARYDTLLMGRKTYEAAAAMGSGGSGPFAGMRVIVVSRTLRPADHPRVRIATEDLKSVVAEPKAQEGRDIWLFGGGDLFRSCLELGLVDSVEVAVIPVLLGEGIPLLTPPVRKTELQLAGRRIYEKTGTVWLQYGVAPKTARIASKRSSPRP
jgi:dihydrofolate reductase